MAKPGFLATPQAYALFNALNGATLDAYLGGTLTPTNFYSDKDLTTSIGSQLTSNSVGIFTSFFLPSNLDIKLRLRHTASGLDQTYDYALVDDSSSSLGFAVVDTITTLKTKAAGYVGAVYVQGHTAAGDGGAGWFIWSSSSSVADDNGCIIQPNAGGTGRWLREVGDYVDLRWYNVNTSAAQTAINSALAFVEAGYSRARRIYIHSTLTCTAAISDLDFQVEIFGSGINGSTLIRNFNGTAATGFLNIRAGGVIIRNLSVQPSAGTTTGNLIDIRTTVANSIGSVVLENLYATTGGTNTHTYTLYVDGTTSLSDLGVRTLRIENCEFFGAATLACYFAGVKNLYWNGGGTYVAGGTSSDITITGTSAVKSEGIQIEISDAGNVVVDSDYCTSADVRVIDPSGFMTRQGSSPTSEIVFWSADSDDKNMLLNGGFQINQEGVTSAADDVYARDGWYVLTNTGSVTISTVTAPELYMPQCIRLAQPDAGAKRMGLAQIVEHSRCRQARGGYITLEFRVRCSLSQAIRYAICEWTGTADSVTSDIVLDWTSSTYTANAFFLAASVNPLLVGSITPTAATWATIARRAQMNISANNLIVFVWTEGTIAQNATLDIGKVKLQRGSAPTRFMDEPFERELIDCERLYEKSFAYATAPAQNVGTLAGAAKFLQAVGASASTQTDGCRFRTRKRAAPTMTFYNPSAANAEARGSGGADCSATTQQTVSDTEFSLTVTTPAGSAAGTANFVHYVANVRL